MSTKFNQSRATLPRPKVCKTPRPVPDTNGGPTIKVDCCEEPMLQSLTVTMHGGSFEGRQATLVWSDVFVQWEGFVDSPECCGDDPLMVIIICNGPIIGDFEMEFRGCNIAGSEFPGQPKEGATCTPLFMDWEAFSVPDCDGPDGATVTE